MKSVAILQTAPELPAPRDMRPRLQGIPICHAASTRLPQGIPWAEPRRARFRATLHLLPAPLIATSGVGL